jgi:predicted MFS family arabinose efflux permease
LVIAGLAVIAVTYGLARYGYGLYLPQFRAEFGFSAGAAGVVAAGSYLGYCAAALVARRLTGAGLARRTLWLAGGSAALGCLLVATAWNGAALAVGAVLAGSGSGAATPAMVAAVAGTVPSAAEPRAQGTVNSGTGAGVVAGGLLVLAIPGAWRWSWVGFAIAALLVTRWADRRSRWRPGPEQRSETGAGSPFRGLRRPLAAAVLAGAGCAGVWTFGRDLMAVDGDLPARVTGLLWCVLGAAGLLGGLSGVLVQRAGLRTAWAASVTVAAAGTALLAAFPSGVAPAGAALALFGAAFVALSGVLIAWGTRSRPDGAAAAAAFLFVGLTAGQAIGSVGLGLLASDLGLSTALLLAAATVLLAAGVTDRPIGRGTDERPGEVAAGRSP